MNINRIITKLSSIKRFCKYALQYKSMLKMQHIANTKVEGEEEYRRYWGRFTKLVEPYSYRLFSHYCGKTKYIIPEDIGHSYIEAVLNNERFTAYYSDKNMFPVYLPQGAVPSTLLCRIGGGNILDRNYNLASVDFSSSALQISAYIMRMYMGGVFLKPSTGSSSGRGVMKFKIDDKKQVYINSEGQELNGALLQQYGNDWVLQTAVEQHPYLAQFCHSSLNSLRICTYRSVKDEKITILSAAIRIGHEGSVVDNLHAGGGFVGIDVATGKLGHEVYDQYANRTTILNDIDFANSNFVIPEWNRIVEFCKKVAKINHHCRLIALDITLDKDSQPRFIEWNVGGYGFSFWIPMMTGITPFGDKTDEVVEYCLAHRKI